MFPDNNTLVELFFKTTNNKFYEINKKTKKQTNGKFMPTWLLNMAQKQTYIHTYTQIHATIHTNWEINIKATKNQ